MVKAFRVLVREIGGHVGIVRGECFEKYPRAQDPIAGRRLLYWDILGMIELRSEALPNSSLTVAETV
jgi:hypothetical protein